MTSDLLAALPRILALVEFRRARETGEVTLESASVREAATKIGFDAPITRFDIRRAMLFIGAAPHTKTARGARYVFEGVFREREIIERAARQQETQ